MPKEGEKKYYQDKNVGSICHCQKKLMNKDNYLNKKSQTEMYLKEKWLPEVNFVSIPARRFYQVFKRGIWN